MRTVHPTPISLGLTTAGRGAGGGRGGDSAQPRASVELPQQIWSREKPKVAQAWGAEGRLGLGLRLLRPPPQTPALRLHLRPHLRPPLRPPDASDPRSKTRHAKARDGARKRNHARAKRIAALRRRLGGYVGARACAGCGRGHLLYSCLVVSCLLDLGHGEDKEYPRTRARTDRPTASTSHCRSP